MGASCPPAPLPARAMAPAAATQRTRRQPCWTLRACMVPSSRPATGCLLALPLAPVTRCVTTRRRREWGFRRGGLVRVDLPRPTVHPPPPRHIPPGSTRYAESHLDSPPVPRLTCESGPNTHPPPTPP